jgi:hypothetical protein
VTRWRLEDLRATGSRCGLTILRAGANRLGGLEIEHFWNLRNQLAAALGLRQLPGGRIVPKVLSQAYRKLGLRYLVPGWGTSVYALYQRQA